MPHRNTQTGRFFQVVDASTRGDRCYETRRGWHWHYLDELSGIDESTIHGPFPSYEEAYASAAGDA